MSDRYTPDAIVFQDGSVMSLVWDEAQPPKPGRPYCQTTAETPLGRIVIKWRAGKTNPEYNAALPWDDHTYASSLEAMKETIQEAWNAKIRECGALAPEFDKLKARVAELEALFCDMDGHDGGLNKLDWDCLQFALEEKSKRLDQIKQLEDKTAQVEAWMLAAEECEVIIDWSNSGNQEDNPIWSSNAKDALAKARVLDTEQVGGARLCQHCGKFCAVKECSVSTLCRVCEACWHNCEGNFSSCPAYDSAGKDEIKE